MEKESENTALLNDTTQGANHAGLLLFRDETGVSSHVILCSGRRYAPRKTERTDTLINSTIDTQVSIVYTCTPKMNRPYKPSRKGA